MNLLVVFLFITSLNFLVAWLISLSVKKRQTYIKSKYDPTDEFKETRIQASFFARLMAFLCVEIALITIITSIIH